MPPRAKTVQQLAAKYSRQAGVSFSKAELEKLVQFYRDQTDTAGRDRLDRITFRDILLIYFHITDDMIMDRVFRGFDQDNDLFISMDEWVKGLSIYLRGSLEDQILFTFDIYDLNNDGYISREEMLQLLKLSIAKPSIDEEADETIKDLVEITMRMLDKDSDGRASLQDFRDSVYENGLLLEALGKCLPDDAHKLTFMTAMENNSWQK